MIILRGSKKQTAKNAYFIGYVSHDAAAADCLRFKTALPYCSNSVKSRIIKCLMALKSGKMRWYECRLEGAIKECQSFEELWLAFPDCL